MTDRLEVNSRMGYMLGTRYYRYLEDEKRVDIIRLMKEEPTTKKELEVLDERTKSKRMVPESILTGEYTKLIPDGFAIFSIVRVVDHKDVCIAVFRQSDVMKAPAMPYMICRQAVHDIFSQLSHKPGMMPTVGMCISQDTCPPNVNFQDILAADEIVHNRRMAIYQEDDVDTICSILPTRKYDQVLREYEVIERHNYFGLCDTLKDLMNSNKFMQDFNAAFGIKEVPFDPTPDEDGYLPLDCTYFIEDMLKVNIINTYVIEYSKYVEEESIVRNHLKVVGPGKRKIWVVGYDIAEGDYQPRIKPST